jgi:hypothetical protein
LVSGCPEFGAEICSAANNADREHECRPEPTMVSKRRLLELLHLLMNRFGAPDS